MNERYDNLDGLRTISCIGIIAMHVKANADYQISGYVFDSIIPSWSLFVYLFLLISGFGMFCGYYERFRNNTVDVNQFYQKRYKKILPFFLSLIIIDVIIEHSVTHIIEGLTEATLVFGLLPNNQPNVIGVAWTLGVIFLFYMLFPFFVWLCWNKKRAWFGFIVSIIINIFCDIYFFTDKFVVSDFAPRHNFLYCAPFFIGGGIIYLYKKEIKEFVKQKRWMCLTGCITISILYYALAHPNIDINRPGPILLIVFIPWLCYAISVNSRILSNKAMKYLSGISLELYLAQMVVFRAIEKIKCLYLFGTGWISFIIVLFGMVVGLIVFIEIWKKLWMVIEKRILRFGE